MTSLDSSGLARIERLDPRDAWRDEARDLTPWLLQNIDLLAASLGTEIIPAQREVRVGRYSLDVLGEDASGRPVIVENQLEPTDHSHLGQLLVYASGLDAGIIVWLTPSFREEHRQALDWLNERTDETVHFFGVQLELIRVGGSAPAPDLRVVVKPNEWQKSVRRQTGSNPQQELRSRFFEVTFDVIGDLLPTFRRPSVQNHQGWVSCASGPFGYYAISFAQYGRLRTEIYLDSGDKDRNKALFDLLLADAESVASVVGDGLEWERLDDKRACRIARYCPTPELDDDNDMPEVAAWAAESILSFMNLDGRLRDLARQLRATGESSA